MATRGDVPRESAARGRPGTMMRPSFLLVLGLAALSCGPNPADVACQARSDCPASVACVSGKCQVTGGRYFVGTDTVEDATTGSTWQRQVLDQSVDWSEAKAYCASLSLEGQKWRLPSVDELLTLVDMSGGQRPTIDMNVFPNTPAGLFWTKNVAPPSSAWYVSFFDGYPDYSDVGNEGCVRCVR